jgi:hypothetical protein
LFAGVFLAASALTVSATAGTEPQKFNPAETWIVEKVTAGDVADLDGALNSDGTKRFPGEKDRKIGAHFLQDLLTGVLPGAKPHRSGVRVRGAIIDQLLDLINAQLPWEVWLENCRFGDVLFIRTSFEGAALFNGSTFKTANFNAVKVRETLFLKGVVFQGAANFTAAEIRRNFEAQGSKFQTKEEEARFGNMEIGGSLFFDNAVFEGPVTFGGTVVAGDLAMGGAQFLRENDGANFYGMKIGHCAYFPNAVFDGPAGFVGTRVASNFEAQKVKFRNKKADVNFNSIEVKHSAFFNEAVFEGPANFGSANIASDFALTSVQFQNTEKEVNLNSMKVGHTLFLDKAVFAGSVNLGGTEIGGSLEAFDAFFKNEEKEASFNSVKIGNAAFFKRAEFEGPVNFIGADIVSNFEAQEAQFKSKTHAVKLTIKCGRKGLFTETLFSGEASFADSSFVDLMIDGKNSTVPKLDLSRIVIKRQLSVEKIKIHDFVARSLHVEGPTNLTDILVEHAADLRYGDYAGVNLVRSVWPKDGAGGRVFYLQGMKYRHIVAEIANESKSHDKLMHLANQAAFSPDVYANLEAFFLREGYGAHADRAFIAGKRRERREFLHGGRFATSLFLDRFVGYGRHTWWASFYCAFIIIAGSFLFSSQKMELQKSDDAPRARNPVWFRLGVQQENVAPRIYSPFWYSFGLFLPVVSFESDKIWRPKPEQTFLTHYARVHILLGWILIPIVLAALTGFIK